MIDLVFPDGSVRQFPEGTSGRDVANSISPSLAKRTLLVRLDGRLLDFDRPLPGGGRIELVTTNVAEVSWLPAPVASKPHCMPANGPLPARS